MKKYLILALAAVAGAALLSSCKKNLPDPVTGDLPGETATLTIALEGIDADISDTRASSTTEHSGDKTATSTQILIFDSAGNMIKKITAAGSVTLSKGMTYTVAALVNGPQVDGTLSQLEVVMADLDDYPFVMYGKNTADLTSADSKTVSVSVTSFASRVHVTSIRNNMPPAFGALTIKRVFLCNVQGGVFLNGNSAGIWYNQYGRKALSTRITANSLEGAPDSSTTGAASTVASFSDQAVAAGATYSPDSFLYSFPNPLKTAIPANLATLTTWTEQATWVTVCGSVGGTVYYWTANLGAKLTSGLERNHSYDVSLVINNLGTSDPGTPVTQGSASISVSVTPWTAGSEINETI